MSWALVAYLGFLSGIYTAELFHRLLRLGRIPFIFSSGGGSNFSFSIAGPCLCLRQHVFHILAPGLDTMVELLKHLVSEPEGGISRVGVDRY